VILRRTLVLYVIGTPPKGQTVGVMPVITVHRGNRKTTITLTGI
jgi:hypothetical protein